MHDAERPLPRRLRKRVAECLRWSLQDVDACWLAERLSVVTPDYSEPRIVPLETLLFADDKVLLDGARLGRTVEPAYVLLNKPKHVTSTARDPDGKRDLSEYLRAMPEGCAPVGRLDRETTGLLLCTNDGDLANAVLRPDHHTTKTYWLWLDDELASDDPRLAALVSGVTHNGELLQARSARITAQSEHATELELCLTHGKKRQIRHMCWALELHLVHLHRRQIGPLTDAGLAVGEWRLLSSTEVEALWQAVGGRADLRARKVAALRRNAAEARAAGAPHLRLELWLRDEIDGTECGGSEMGS
jgi:23S rRNA pseudouridine2605 synthase